MPDTDANTVLWVGFFLFCLMGWIFAFVTMFKDND